nr:phospholipase D family protein [Psychrobacter sp.]
MTAGAFALSLSACNTLPNTPHITKSIQLTDSINEHYALKSSASLEPPVNSILVTQTSSKHSSVSGSEVSNLKKTQLQKSILQQGRLHPNQSGYHTILTGADAFASRSILTDMATESIDVQYYIWHDDQAGQLLLKKLWQAADRGVVVRLLLDDFNTNAALDKHLLRFASHPNIAVRLINPMSFRKFHTLNYFTNLSRINHRMHNKSMTFDRRLSIVGGRNVGDEYLSNDKKSQFADLDVLLIGNVVKDVNNSFEQYWNSDISYDIETLVNHKSSKLDVDINYNPKIKTEEFISSLEKIYPEKSSANNNGLNVYNRALENSTIDADLINQQVPFRWAQMTFLSDNVEKLLQNTQPQANLVAQLRHVLGTPTKNLSIISSYFVPTKDGVNTLIKLAQQGVKVRILTNSFNATDVAAVHAGYAQWRVPLLQAGIEIYELKATASKEARENKLWRARSQSSTSLHAKAFAIDDHSVFIGSYNIDPRSANINTEMGVVIKDDNLARQLHMAISDDLLNLAYKVVLTDNNRLQWQTLENDQIISYDKEPNVDLKDSLWISLMSSMPIDWLL